jgi:hypothetical protein
MRNVLVLIGLLAGLGATAQKAGPMDFTVKQGASKYTFGGGYQKIELARLPFTLEFSLPEAKDKSGTKCALQLCFVKDSVHAVEFGPDMSINELPWFQPGTGIATTGEYRDYHVNPAGHYYIMYEMKGEQRAQLVKAKKGKLRLSTEIWKLLGEETRPFWMKQVTMLVIADLNQDGVLQEGEFYRVYIRFNQ